MVQIADDGGGGGRTVRVNAEGILEIVRTHVRPAYDDVMEAMKIFKTVPDGAAGFGGSDAGADLARLHSATKNVFTDTVRGVGDDLDTFGHNLRQGAKAWETSDETTAERARQLVEKLAPAAAAPLSTHRNYENSRTEQASKLDLSENLQHEEKESDEVTEQPHSTTGDRTETQGSETREDTGPSEGNASQGVAGQTQNESG